MTERPHVTAHPYLAGLRGRCPRCGEGKLFAGYLQVAPRCERCGLDLAFADSGDGPAVFIMMIVGFIAVGSTLWLESHYAPPVWVYLAVELPLVAGLVLGLLRPAKGLLIAAQFHNKAEQGRLDR